MADPTDDAERIAALLDGKLDARERAEVLARLDASDAALEAFADAAAVMREARPQRATSVWRWNRAPLAIAAAILVAAVLVPIVRSRSEYEGTDPGQLGAILSGNLPPDWNGTPWTTTRGPESLTREARAARLGARLVDLEVAAHQGDTTTGRIALEIATLLESIPASAPVVAIYHDIASARPTRPEQQALVAEAGETATVMAGRELVDRAAWTEAVRIAVARHDTTQFRALVNRQAHLDDLPAVASAARRGEAIDWNACDRELTALLADLAR